MQIDGYSLDAQRARMKAYADLTIMKLLASMKMQENPANLLKDGYNSTR